MLEVDLLSESTIKYQNPGVSIEVFDSPIIIVCCQRWEITTKLVYCRILSEKVSIKVATKHQILQRQKSLLVSVFVVDDTSLNKQRNFKKGGKW